VKLQHQGNEFLTSYGKRGGRMEYCADQLRTGQTRDRGFIPGKVNTFSSSCPELQQRPWGPTNFLLKGKWWSLPRGKSGQGVNLNTHFLSSPQLRMRILFIVLPHRTALYYCFFFCVLYCSCSCIVHVIVLYFVLVLYSVLVLYLFFFCTESACVAP
jgi:hypothetical protein